jgi:N6-adenosine-specific RNA methylase IME4
MTTDEICAMPVQEIVAEEAVLFLWATNPMLRDALRVIEAWGLLRSVGHSRAEKAV